MSRQQEELWKMVRLYRQETGVKDWCHLDVAAWAKRRGFKMPKPPTEEELLAKKLSRVMREALRTDPKTGHSYRANHAYPSTRDGETVMFWVDIDERPARDKMDKSLKLRREQMVGDAVQLTIDARRWNDLNPEQDPLQIELDFSDDVAWRLNAPAAEDLRRAG